MSIINNKKIAIVGGGPGGLTLARLLQMNGANVTVYERDAHKDARPKGATLDLHDESGLKALAEAGLMDAFRSNYRPGADKLTVMDQHAEIVLKDDVNKEGYPSRPEIDRGPLQSILLNSLKPGTVAWNSHFIMLSAVGEGWNLVFANGETVYADIVIAADGANSKIRPYLTPIRPFFAGITAVEASVYDAANAVPEINELLDGGKIFAMGDSKSLIVSSKGDGSLVFYPGFASTENWAKESGIDFNNKDEVLGWFKAAFTGWDPLWYQLLEQAGTPFIARPQYCMPLDQSWETKANLTMLGDAAHLMPPYAGEGVNMAMLDALELSQCLLNNNFPNAHSAIAGYEQQMLQRASETAEMTLQSTAALHSPDAISFLIDVIG